MYQVISDQHDYLAVKFTGKVDKEEYQEILANLRLKPRLAIKWTC